MTYLTQFRQPAWWPFSLRLGGPYGFAYCRIPGSDFRFISWNVQPDSDERVVWQSGLLNITRLETDEERDERLETEAEADYEAMCADHYSY